MEKNKNEIVVEIDGLMPEPIVVDLKKALKISEDIDFEVDHAAYFFGHYAVLAEKADIRYERLKFSFEEWQSNFEARLYRERDEEIKSNANDDKKIKQYTEAQLKAIVRAEPKYSAYRSRLLKLDHDRKILRAIKDALSDKVSLIQTKAANRRKENS
jgi:hypothetical protein